MSGETRVAVVTGASSGIGKEAAKALAGAGWHVIAHGRSPGRAAEAKAEIEAAAATGAKIDMVLGDLALLCEAERVASEIAALTPRIDVLLNNAGGVRNAREVTSEGNEVTFAGNHLGQFLLTERLLPLLRKAASESPAGATRIVQTSSSAHLVTQAIDWDDFQHIDNWSSVGAYGFAKLANILFTRELARRLEGTGIVVHALHPGMVDTNFASHGTKDMQDHFAAHPAIAAADAAAPLVWLATADEPGRSSGDYWAQGVKEDPSALARDDANAARLWSESERLVERFRQPA